MTPKHSDSDLFHLLVDFHLGIRFPPSGVEIIQWKTPECDYLWQLGPEPLAHSIHLEPLGESRSSTIRKAIIKAVAKLTPTT